MPISWTQMIGGRKLYLWRRISNSAAGLTLQVNALQLIRMRRSRKVFLVAGEFYAMQANTHENEFIRTFFDSKYFFRICFACFVKQALPIMSSFLRLRI